MRRTSRRHGRGGSRSRVSRNQNGAPHPGLATLRQATFLVDASLSTISGGKLRNIGTGGSALDATFGSTTGVDTNDPTLLAHTGTNYLYLPGLAGNQASVPDIAAYDITGDIELVALIRPDDWTPALAASVIGRDSGDPNRAFNFRLEVTGVLRLIWYPTGSAASVVTATGLTATGAADGSWLWVKATLDVDNGSTQNVVTFYTAPYAGSPTEPTSWTQLGTPVVTAGVTSLPAVVSNMSVGNTAGAMLEGGVMRAIVRNGIGGTTVFDADFTRGITSGGQTAFTESSSNAATVTISRATSGRKSVAVVRNVLLLGTDDYLEVADNALLDFGATDSFTALVIVRQWAAATAFSYLTHAQGGSPILGFSVGPSRALIISDGVVANVATGVDAPVAGALTLMAGVRNVSLDQLIPYRNNNSVGPVTDLTTGTLASPGPMLIGKDGGGALYQDFEFVAAAVFRRALTAAEIASIVAYYGAA